MVGDDRGGGPGTGFVGLAAARVASASARPRPILARHSLLSDYFPARNRSVVLGIYMLGVHLGGAASLIAGGLILQNWSNGVRVVSGRGLSGLGLARGVSCGRSARRDPGRPLSHSCGNQPGRVRHERRRSYP